MNDSVVLKASITKSVKTSDGSSDEKLNKSDNWAETSFGREVMNVVKNNSYKQAVRDEQTDSDDSSAADDELDELLAEALDGAGGPTPPKLNKNGDSISSCKSFEYKQEVEKAYSEGARFKSPLKAGGGGGASAGAPSSRPDKGGELVHSVSFYRRMQNASSQPSTPMRVIRHASPEREDSAGGEAARVTTVRERIKDLQEEICKQQTVISQASQALNLCAATIEFSGSTEQAEGERLLLLAIPVAHSPSPSPLYADPSSIRYPITYREASNALGIPLGWRVVMGDAHRRQACLHEVQRLQVEGAGPAAAAGAATLHIRGLTVPLRRDYIRQLNADGAVGHHAVCLLKCRDRVLATSMRLTQPSEPCLRFPDDVRMEGLNSDFKVTVEIYLLQATKEILPHEVKYHIFSKKPNSKLLTPKSKVSELKTPRVQSPGGPLSVRSPQFQLHGYCIFALAQANRKSFTLNKVPHGSPLEGSVSVDITARVVAPPPAPHAAFLTAFDDVSGLGAWHRRWFALHLPRLAYWKYPDDVGKKMPIGDIDLATVVSEKVLKAPRDLCARPNTILLECSIPAGIVPDTGSLVYVKKPNGKTVRRHLLAADTPADRDVWLQRLNEALEYVRCTGNMDDE
ncbi:Anillin [Eumeta japonica]|uniref:Anillin n=1 Tax=Eumeta variegata TaxID=151549 RepID=A0A4C1WUV1_EUMVA|nr:Anillin [Eumeta japonica]